MPHATDHKQSPARSLCYSKMKNESKEDNDLKARNPFIPKPKATVRRIPSEVYPCGTDFLKPQFLGNSPLDKLFQRIELALDGNIEDFTLNSLGQKILGQDRAHDLTEYDLRYAIITELLRFLFEITHLSLTRDKEIQELNLITISLHDMKTLSKVINLIIIWGIYPATSAFGIGIAIEKRRMASHSKGIVKYETIPPLKPDATNLECRWSFHLRLLELIHREFSVVFDLDSDARSLLLNGTGFSDFLVTTLTLASVREFGTLVNTRYLEALNNVTAIPSTYELYQIYSVLMSSPSPPYFRKLVLERLEQLPFGAVKGDGVLSLIEFVIGLRESEETGIQKVDQVSDILLLKPRGLSTREYFESIGSQCYEILININRPLIGSTVAHFIDRLWLKNNRVAVDFFYKKIQVCFAPPTNTGDSVLVTEAQLNCAINVLLSLTRVGMSKDALASLCAPIWLDLWSYYTFLRSKEKSSSVFEDILVSILSILNTDHSESAYSLLKDTANNLVYENNKNYRFRLGPNQLVEIAQYPLSVINENSSEREVLAFLTTLDNNVRAFSEILKRLDFKVAQKLFLFLLSKWLSLNPIDKDLDLNPFVKLIDLKILELIAREFRNELSKTPYDSLKLMHTILKKKNSPSHKTSKGLSQLAITSFRKNEDIDSDDEEVLTNEENIIDEDSHDEVFKVVFALLSVIVQEARASHLNTETRDELATINLTLEGMENIPEVLPIRAQISTLISGESSRNDTLDSQRQRLNRALNDINGSLVPVRAQGLVLLRQLIEEDANVISVDFVVKTHITQLGDPDPFVYLNAIKGLVSLLSIHNEEVLGAILKAYAGHDKHFSSLEDRLKLGEALMRYVQSQGEALVEKPAQKLASVLLAIVKVNKSEPEAIIDDRLRMSSMSILGMCFKTNVLGFISYMNDALDCAIGILQFENGKRKASMRRSAIVLVHDLIAGTSTTEEAPFPLEYRQRVLTTLRNVKDTDPDLITKEQAYSVLQYINELVELAIMID